LHVRAIFCSCAMYVHVHVHACISFLVSSRYLRLFMPRNSETKLLGNNAGTSVDFTARHLRTPSCGTFGAKLCSSSLRAKLRNPRSEPPRQDEFSTFAKHSSCEPSLGYGRTSQAAVGTFAPGCVRHLHVLSKATTKRGSEFKKLRSYQTFGEPNK